MIGYKNLSEEELRALMESSSLTDYEKLDILTELIERGCVELDRVEYLH